MSCESGLFARSTFVVNVSSTMSILAWICLLASLFNPTLHLLDAGKVQELSTTTAKTGFNTFGLPLRKHGLDLIGVGMRRMYFTDAYAVGLYSKTKPKPTTTASNLSSYIADSTGRWFGPDSVLFFHFHRPMTTEDMTTWLTSKLSDTHGTDSYKEILARFHAVLDQGLGSKGLIPNDELSFLYRSDRIVLKWNDKNIGTISPTSITSTSSTSSSIQKKKTGEKPLRFPHIAKHYPRLHQWITTKLFRDPPSHEYYGNGVKAIQRLKQRLMDAYVGEASVAPELREVLKEKYLM